MPSTYKTPGVYIEEIPKFPPSVAQVETAIPAFIGYTEKAINNGEELIRSPDKVKKFITPLRIKSLLEYETYFGGNISPQSIEVHLSNDAIPKVEKVTPIPAYNLYDSLRLFFDNGGGACYIVAVGLYDDTTGIVLDDFKYGLEAIKKLDEPTMLVAPDAVNLGADDLGALQKLMLAQCAALQDRIAILDVQHNPNSRQYEIAETDDFREKVGSSNVSYGAAYFPWLRTVYSYPFRHDLITLTKTDGPTSFTDYITSTPLIGEVDLVYVDLDKESSLTACIQEAYTYADIKASQENNADLLEAELISRIEKTRQSLEAFIDLTTTLNDMENASTSISNTAKSAKQIHDLLIKPGTDSAFGKIESIIRRLILLDQCAPKEDELDTFVALGVVENKTEEFNDGTTRVYATDISSIKEAEAPKLYGNAETYIGRLKYARPHFQNLHQELLSIMLDFREQLKKRAESLETALQQISPFYSNVVQAIKKVGVVLPPSAAIAGVYAAVDYSRGVWKAPANVSLNSVIEPTVTLDDKDQEALNVDTNAGKSINAIRAFRGKGTLVWGARTLAGNDNEWRYVSVRRFFNMVEESVKKATEPFVFEPNDANTWVKVRAMIENYLTTLWRQGALAGAKPEHAFYVRVGLGQTMTALDILEGRMIVEIGMAVVRPAEFIIIRFSHKMQES